MRKPVIVFQHFSRVIAVFLALIQFLLGLSLVAVQIAGIFFGLISTHLGASGIWAGVFVVLSGIGGLLAAVYRTPGAIASFMITSAVATLAAPAVVVTSTISFMEIDDFCKSTTGTMQCQADMVNLKKTLDLTLIIVAVVEYCFAASCLVICCWTLYCDPAGYQLEEKKPKKSAKHKRNMELEDRKSEEGELGFPAIVEEEEPDEADDEEYTKRWKRTPSHTPQDEVSNDSEDTESTLEIKESPETGEPDLENRESHENRGSDLEITESIEHEGSDLGTSEPSDTHTEEKKEDDGVLNKGYSADVSE